TASAQRYRGHYSYGRHYGHGDAVAAGVFGLALGAIIGSAASEHRRYYDRGYYNRGYYDRGYYDEGYYGGGCGEVRPARLRRRCRCSAKNAAPAKTATATNAKSRSHERLFLYQPMSHLNARRRYALPSAATGVPCAMSTFCTGHARMRSTAARAALRLVKASR